MPRAVILSESPLIIATPDHRNREFSIEDLFYRLEAFGDVSIRNVRHSYDHRKFYEVSVKPADREFPYVVNNEDFYFALLQVYKLILRIKGIDENGQIRSKNGSGKISGQCNNTDEER